MSRCLLIAFAFSIVIVSTTAYDPERSRPLGKYDFTEDELEDNPEARQILRRVVATRRVFPGLGFGGLGFGGLGYGGLGYGGLGFGGLGGLGYGGLGYGGLGGFGMFDEEDPRAQQVGNSVMDEDEDHEHSSSGSDSIRLPRRVLWRLLRILSRSQRRPQRSALLIRV